MLRTEGRTDGRKDNVKLVYPKHSLRGYNEVISYWPSYGSSICCTGPRPSASGQYSRPRTNTADLRPVTVPIRNYLINSIILLLMLYKTDIWEKHPPGKQNKKQLSLLSRTKKKKKYGIDLLQIGYTYFLLHAATLY